MQHELYKIVSNKFAVFVAVLFVPLYIGLTYMDYYWHSKQSWENICSFPYGIGTIYEGAIILVALAGIFSQEHALNTSVIIVSTKRGRREIASAKMIAASGFIASIVMIVWIVNIVVNITMAGVAGWDLPIQALEDHSHSPYSLKVWQYTMIQIGTNFIGCLAFVLFVLWLSSVNRSILLTFFVGGIIFMLPFLIRNFSDLSIPWALKNLLLTETMRVVNLFNRPRFVEVLDSQISLKIWFFYLYSFFVGALFTSGIFKSVKKYD